MSYQIKFSNQARRFFNSLEPKIQERVRMKFIEILKDPSRYLEHFEGEYGKLRIGKLRALVDIDNNKKIIWVRVFDRRGRIYK